MPAIPASHATPGDPYLTGAEGGVKAPVKVLAVRADGVDIEHLKTGQTHTVETGFLLTPAKAEGDGYVPSNGTGDAVDVPPPPLPVGSAPPGGLPALDARADAPAITPAAAPKKAKKAKKAKVQDLPMAKGCITHIRGTIKGNVDLEIPARHVLIIGDNASHKTGLIQQVELAIEAGAGDIAGRDWVAGTGELITLVDPRLATEVRAEIDCETPDGRKGTYTFVAPLKSSNKTGIGKADHTIPDNIKAVLPARAILRELRGKPERSRKFLLGVACALTEKEVLAGIPAELHPRYAALAPKDTQTTTYTPTERLIVALDASKKAAATAKKDAERLDKEVQAAASKLDARPDEDDLQAARETLLEAQGAVVTAARTERPLPPPPASTLPPPTMTNAASAAEIQARMAEMQAEFAKLQPLIAAGLPEATLKKLGVMGDALEITLGEGSESCLLCANPLPTTVQRKIEDGVHALSVQNETAILSRIRVAELQRAYVDCEQRIAALQAPTPALPTPTAPTEAPEAVPTEEDESAATPLTLAEAQQAQQEAQDALQALRDAASGWTNLDGVRARQQTTAALHRDLEYLHNVLSDLVANKVIEGSRAWVARVQKHLIKGDKFWFDSSTGRYGLVRQVEYPDGTTGARKDSALCGAEWARVTMALCAACVPSDVDVAVLVPEDRDWGYNGRSLRTALDGLSAFPGQILFPTATRPYRGVPKGWGVIVLDKAGKVLLSVVNPDTKTFDAALKLAFAV